MTRKDKSGQRMQVKVQCGDLVGDDGDIGDGEGFIAVIAAAHGITAIEQVRQGVIAAEVRGCCLVQTDPLCPYLSPGMGARVASSRTRPVRSPELRSRCTAAKASMRP